MEPEFWHNRWQSEKNGWQQERVNSRLQRYWPSLGIESGRSVFVPLCGDSIDMIWLLEQGYSVVGSELSETAVKRFFETYNITFERSESDSVIQYSGHYQNSDVRLLCGNIFSLSAIHLGTVSGVYDRAATVALPTDLRLSYANHLAALVPTKTQVLLISMEYDQQKMKGPPFSVPDDEVHRLYDANFKVKRLGGAEGPEILGSLADRGLDTLVENVYELTRH